MNDEAFCRTAPAKPGLLISVCSGSSFLCAGRAGTGVELTSWAEGEVIPLCLTQTKSRVNREGVTVLRQQMVNQKLETHPVSFLSLNNCH